MTHQGPQGCGLMEQVAGSLDLGMGGGSCGGETATSGISPGSGFEAWVMGVGAWPKLPRVVGTGWLGAGHGLSHLGCGLGMTGRGLRQLGLGETFLAVTWNRRGVV